MSPKNKNTEERRAQILAAATAVFAAKGFHNATMNDIVAASGTSKGGLYWHFASKDDLIAAILQQFFAQEMAEIDALLTADAPVGERLQQLAQQAVADLQAMADLMGITLEFYAVAARQESVRHTLQTYFRQYRQALAQLVQQGIDARELGGCTADDAAVALTAQFEGLALLWTIDPEAIDLAHSTETAVALLLAGLRSGGNAEDEAR